MSISGADKVVTKLVFVNRVKVERIVRAIWKSFASIRDGVEAVCDVQMLRGSPFKDEITSLDVNFLDEAVPDVLIPDIIKVTAGWANVKRGRLKYNDQRGALGC